MSRRRFAGHQLSLRALRRALFVLVPAALGAVVAVWLIANRQAPERDAAHEAATPVEAIAAPEVGYVPRATGYGEARPARSWRAVAEVPGEIVDRHSELQSGAILAAGTTLFRIDPTDYELAIAESEAAITAQEARIAELEQRQATTQSSLEIERRRLEVARRELQRQETLRERGTVPQATLDKQEREFLQQRQAVQELRNTLDLLPAERDRLEAELARERTRLRRAERDLARTTITAPFDLRVAASDTETGQVVAAGATLMHADAVAASEVEAEVPIARFRALLDPARRPATGSVSRLREMLPAMGLTAEVRLRTGGEPVTWDARVDRISEAIDVETRTVGAVVVVDRPYARARPPERPPLVKGMYVEVRLCAPARPPAVVVPRAALHAGRVYVAGPDDRLQLREVEVADRQGGFAVIRAGVEAGERIVLTDLVPAIAGMKLAPRRDEAALRQLRADARGEKDCP